MASKKKNKNSGENTNQPVSQQSGSPRAQTAQHQAQQHPAVGRPNQAYPPVRFEQSTRRTAGWQSKLSRRQLENLLRSRLFQLLLVLILAALPSLYFYHKAQQAERTANPSTSNLQTTSEVVKRVSRHILLPSGEQPTVATVSDASKVRSQAFFANAASGDKVLIYAQAKKAYLYRPSIDRLIEVAPLAPNTPKTNQQPSQ